MPGVRGVRGVEGVEAYGVLWDESCGVRSEYAEGVYVEPGVPKEPYEEPGVVGL